MPHLLHRLVPLLLVGLLVGCSTGPTDPSAETPAPRDDESLQRADGPGPGLRYVALGDSYTAAPGLPGSVLPCWRSAANYPSLVAEALEGTVTLVDRSCVGADTSSLLGPQRLGGSEVPPQLEALGPRTDLVTLSMGGNDDDLFTRLLAGCLSVADDDPTGSPCADADGAGSFPDSLQQLGQRLVDAVEEVRRRAPSARVLLVGYPQLVPARGECPDLLPLATGDVAFAHQVNQTLAATVETAAERAGVGHVDLWTASQDHHVCADDPWVNGLGVDDSGAFPFHPLPAGQRAVAELVIAAVG